MCDLTNPILTDADKARAHLEALRWPNGPACPHCGSTDKIRQLEGKSTRPGLHQCNACREHFTVTVGTVMERSHIPLNKWVLAFHLMAASKKGMSAHQLGRMLGLTYKSAWFIAHRIREAMREPTPGPLGGENKVIEVDETYVGGKAKNRAKRPVKPKQAVVSLVERKGKVHSMHVANVTAKTLRPVIVKHISRASYLMTDESAVYPAVSDEFKGHGTVNHSAGEYARGKFWHTNTVENYFSIFKRGIIGTYHHISEAHLQRYAGEFDLRYNTRKISDVERAETALRGIEGKRLTYRGPGASANA